MTIRYFRRPRHGKGLRGDGEADGDGRWSDQSEAFRGIASVRIMHRQAVFAGHEVGEVEVDGSESIRSCPEVAVRAGAAAYRGVDGSVVRIGTAHIVASGHAAQFGTDVEESRLTHVVGCTEAAAVSIGDRHGVDTCEQIADILGRSRECGKPVQR